jgi:Leu/Phe-tRNA-protein transferase
MEKIVRDGKVAVAVSYGYGAGWSTWNYVDPMDARFNQLFLDGKVDEVERICDEEELGYAGGAYGVEIVWVLVGTKFFISEYDGSESLETIDNFTWMEA